MFEDSAIVVAHPDDDILWLSSVLDKVGRIVFCFNESPRNPALGEARSKTIAGYPLPGVSSLGVVEALSYNKANWRQPELTDYGIRLSRNPDADARYQRAYAELLPLLNEVVANCRNVFTHNPWGEYGHEDHILVYRALSRLQPEFGYRLWFTNYCSNRSCDLMNRYISGFDSRYECLPTNAALAGQIADIYRANNCWTWFDDFQWFRQECLMQNFMLPKSGEVLPYGHNFPVNYLKMIFRSGDWQPEASPLKKVTARLKGKLRKVL